MAAPAAPVPPAAPPTAVATAGLVLVFRRLFLVRKMSGCFVLVRWGGVVGYVVLVLNLP